MSDGVLILLLGPDDWDRYKASLAERVGMPAENVRYGGGPACYPCLVASKQVEPHRVVSCYVYERDAASLLAAARVGAAPPSPPSRARVPADHWAFIDATTRHFLALIKLMVDTGICKPAKYEEVYRSFMDMTDEELASARAGLSCDQIKDLLDREG